MDHFSIAIWKWWCLRWEKKNLEKKTPGNRAKNQQQSVITLNHVIENGTNSIVTRVTGVLPSNDYDKPAAHPGSQEIGNWKNVFALTNWLRKN